MDYKEPEWSSPPLHKYSIQLIDDGILKYEFDLSTKSYYTIGSESCDISIEHSSIQSIHSILQHSDEGFLFIYNLPNSSSTLNKTSLPTLEHTQIYSNDFLEFGSFSGQFVVNGPSFIFRREKLFKQGKLVKNIRESLQQVSWGFGEDAVNEAIPEEDFMLFEEKLNIPAIKQRKNLTDKQKKILKKLEQYLEKIENLQKVLEKCQKKGGDSQKESSILEKLENLNGERDLAEESLRSSFFPEIKLKKKQAKGKYDYSSSEDEYYNRVKPSDDKELLSDRRIELQGLVNRRESLAIEINDLATKINEDSEDPLDSFMNENNADLREQNLVSLGSQLREVNERIKKITTEFPSLPLPDPRPPEVHIGYKKRKIESPPPIKSAPQIDAPSSWQPPPDQTGDGLTSLNSKYNY